VGAKTMNYRGLHTLSHCSTHFSRVALHLLSSSGAIGVEVWLVKSIVMIEDLATIARKNPSPSAQVEPMREDWWLA